MNSQQQQQTTIAEGLEFATSKDCLILCQGYAKENGFAVVTRDSSIKKGTLKLDCKHHQQYRKARKEKEDVLDLTNLEAEDTTTATPDPSPAVIKRRNGKTSRMGCTCYFYFSRGLDADKPYVLVKYDMVHNHPMASSINTYYQHRKLTDEQEDDVRNMYDANTKPRAIVDYMNTQHGYNLITKDIANIHQRRFNGLDDQTNKSMGAFIQYLVSRSYDIQWLTDENKRIVAVYFTNEQCIKLARKFNEVVVIDATYKTNRFKLPFVNMVGVNNVGCDDKTLSTFAVAGAWISKEDTDSYTWVLEQLAKTVYMDGNWLPALFVTDQQQSLISAIESVFPSAQHILCYIHLTRNLKVNTCWYFVNIEQWEKAERLFKTMCLTTNQAGFDFAHESLVSLAAKFTNDKGAAVAAVAAFLGRLMKTDKTKKEDLDKMEKMKKKWAGMYVNKMAHFGCQSTNRVEGGHATMKSILSNASGSLQKAFESIHKWYTGMDDRAKRQLDSSRFRESTSFLNSEDMKRVGHLRGQISVFAYEKIKIEVTYAWQHDDIMCDCILRHCFKLHCRHTLPREFVKVPLESIDECWLIGDGPRHEASADKDLPGEPDPSTNVKDALTNKIRSLMAEIDSRINSVTNQEREETAQNLQGLYDTLSGRTSFNETLPPLLRQTNKGRPASTKRDASHFEVVDAEMKKKAKIPKKTANIKDQKWNQLWSSVPTDKVESVYDPRADGNCGFRSLSHAIKGDENLYGDVKKNMLERLTDQEDWYLANAVYLEEDIKKMKMLLAKTGPVDSEHWFYTPDCCQLAADTYSRPIHFHSTHGAMLYLPFTNNSFSSPIPIVLHLKSAHITLVKYRARSRITHPPIYPIYANVCQRANIQCRSHQFTSKP